MSEVPLGAGSRSVHSANEVSGSRSVRAANEVGADQFTQDSCKITAKISNEIFA